MRIALLTTLLLAACAPMGRSLEPAVPATQVPAVRGAAAADEAAGVEFIVNAHAWSGFPDDLDVVTPLLVTIENNGDVPLRIRYRELDLVTDAGVELAAMPPFDVEGTAVEPVTVRMWPSSRFLVAPYMSPTYPFHDRWGGPFAYDPFYYDDTFTSFQRVNLPTGDMIARALPEGVLQPGGRVTGFVYFQNPPETAERVTFTAELVNAETGDQFGIVRIPFTLRPAFAALADPVDAYPAI